MVSQEYINKLAFVRKYEIICHEKIKSKNNVSIVMEQTLRIIEIFITTS